MNWKKEDFCLIGECDASYHGEETSVAREIIMLGNKKMEKVSPMFWRLGIIRNLDRLCILDK